MEISAWVNLSLAIVAVIGVAVALYIGIRSIRENRNLQIMRYKIELLEKMSNWLDNAEACMSPVDWFLPDHPFSERAVVATAIRKQGETFSEVLGEGRKMLGIAMFFSSDLQKAAKTLQQALFKGTGMRLKQAELLLDTHDDNFERVLNEMEKENRNNMQAVDKAIVNLHGNILDARISIFDAISFGENPFKDVN